MNLKILNHEEKKEIEEKLNQQFGIKNIPGMIVMLGKERLFLFTGNLDENKIQKLKKITVLERIGIYLGKEIRGEIRLSIEGSQILKKQITRNIFEMNKEQTEKWMQGSQLNIKTKNRGFLIMKYKNNFMGTGKASEDKIGNFIPKNRRLKISGR